MMVMTLEEWMAFFSVVKVIVLVIGILIIALPLILLFRYIIDKIDKKMKEERDGQGK